MDLDVAFELLTLWLNLGGQQFQLRDASDHQEEMLAKETGRSGNVGLAKKYFKIMKDLEKLRRA